MHKLYALSCLLIVAYSHADESNVTLERMLKLTNLQHQINDLSKKDQYNHVSNLTKIGGGTLVAGLSVCIDNWVIAPLSDGTGHWGMKAILCISGFHAVWGVGNYIRTWWCRRDNQKEIARLKEKRDKHVAKHNLHAPNTMNIEKATNESA